MKRDMEVIRQLLLRAEASEGSLNVNDPFETYQVELIIDAGLVEGRVSEEIREIAQQSWIHRLTWAGHDFLDAERDDTVWRKAKEKVIKPAGSFTFGILVEWLKHEIRSHIPGLDADP